MAAMAGWQDIENDTQSWANTASQIEQTNDSLGAWQEQPIADWQTAEEGTQTCNDTVSHLEQQQQQQNDDFEDADDFGGFGETNADSEGDDFGDFGDFGDFESMPPTVASVSENKTTLPLPAAKPTTTATDTDTDTDTETCAIDTLLIKAAPLFEQSETCIDDKADLLSQCLAQSLDINHPLPQTLADDPDPSNRIDARDLSSIMAFLNNSQNAFPEEPRLLWNLILSVATDKMPESIQSLLLTPRLELEAASGATPENLYTNDAASEEPTLLGIDRIRQLAAQDTVSGSPDMLKLALRSLDTLILEKEQDISKRKDAIDAYNQVIQTLVVQATKLH